MATLKTRILFLAANPKNTPRLRLDQEIREISDGLRRANKRENFVLEQRWAVRPKDVHRAMLDFMPNIVQFSGHGTAQDGIMLEDDTGSLRFVNPQALSELFELFPNVECVILNACYSVIQAEAISNYVDFVIAMNYEISDQVAIHFTVSFYDALGAGQSIEFAYKLACNALKLIDTAEHLIPELISRKNGAGIQNLEEHPRTTTERNVKRENTHVKTLAFEIAQPPPLVFISYAKEDQAHAIELYRQFKDMGFKPWIDQEDILPGEDWALKIKQTLKKSDFLILCISSQSVTKRGYVQKELKMAIDIAQEMPEGSIFLIPVRLDRCEVPYGLSSYQYVDLFEQEAKTKISRAIVVEWNSKKG